MSCLHTPHSPQARVTTGLDNLERLVHAEPKRRVRDGEARAIPPEITSTVGGGELNEGERSHEAARSSELAGRAVANAVPAYPQQRLEEVCCSGAASPAEVNPVRGPVPGEQSGCCVVDPNGIVGVWNHTMRQLRDERMLHLFAGRPRLGSLAHAAEQLRVTVDQIDLMHGGSECNMAVPESQEAILAAVRSGTYSIVWIGTPCSSFSLWWLDKSMRQLRSRQRPAGVAGLPPREQGYLRKHNALVEFSAEGGPGSIRGWGDICHREPA